MRPRILFLTIGLLGMTYPARGLAGEEFKAVPLSPPYVMQRFGASLFIPAESDGAAEILTPGRKHLEIDKSAQRLRAYEEDGRMAWEFPVSTGKPGTDEKGRVRSETRSGIHRVSEVMPFRRWSEDPTIKMLNWIGILPGLEKGIHSLEPVGEFAHYEKVLGQKASHGCVRLSRKDSRWLVRWIGEDWKSHPLIVYIYDRPSRKETPPSESPYRLLLILEEGRYRYDPLTPEETPALRRDETKGGRLMRKGGFLLYRKEGAAWRLVEASDEKPK